MAGKKRSKEKRTNASSPRERTYRVTRITPIDDPVAARKRWHALIALLLEADERPDEEAPARVAAKGRRPSKRRSKRQDAK